MSYGLTIYKMTKMSIPFPSVEGFPTHFFVKSVNGASLNVPMTAIAAEYHVSPADWCKNCGVWVKGTNVGTMVACYILNEIGYGPLHDSTS